MIAAMDPSAKEQLSGDWLARVNAATCGGSVGAWLFLAPSGKRSRRRGLFLQGPSPRRMAWSRLHMASLPTIRATGTPQKPHRRWSRTRFTFGEVRVVQSSHTPWSRALRNRSWPNVVSGTSVRSSIPKTGWSGGSRNTMRSGAGIRESTVASRQSPVEGRRSYANSCANACRSEDGPSSKPATNRRNVLASYFLQSGSSDP